MKITFSEPESRQEETSSPEVEPAFTSVSQCPRWTEQQAAGGVYKYKFAYMNIQLSYLLPPLLLQFVG